MTAIDVMTSLEKYGPYAIIVFMGIAYIQKDKMLMKEVAKNQEINKQLITVIEGKTQTDTKLESALTGLKEVIMILVNRIN